MKTITKTITLYSFDELSKEAQEKAIDDYRFDMYWHDFNEYQNSLSTFCDRMNWSHSIESDSYGNFFHVSIAPSDDLEPYADSIQGLRLRTWLINNVLPEITKGRYLKHIGGFARYSKISKEYDITGTWCDHDLIQTTLTYINDLTVNCDGYGLTDYINDLCSSFADSMEKDHNYFWSDEAIIESIECNEYDFIENGSIY